MPRSKRKSSQRGAAVELDFAKKKQRLGGRAKAANLTSTSFKSRQVHVPAQGRAATAADKSGLTLVELLQRARHYNAATRVAALNGLARAVCDERAAAHEQARAQLGTVLAAGLDALCDEAAGVRKAGRETSVRCVGEMREVRPFARLMAATLNAGLSHVRTELRVEAARATVEILEAGKVGGEVVFGGEGNPMEALKELVGIVKSDKARVRVTQAVAALCQQGVCGKGEQEGMAVVVVGKGRRFYYQQKKGSGGRTSARGDGSASGLLMKMSGEDAGELLARITYLAMECLPIAECAGSSGRRELLASTAVALGAVTCEHSLSSKVGVSALKRMLKKWREERRRAGKSGKDIGEAERALAGAALKCGEVEIAGEYLKRVLQEKGRDAEGDREADALVKGYLVDGADKEGVGIMWLERFEEKGMRGDEEWVKGRVESVTTVLSALKESSRGEGVEKVIKVGMELGRREAWEGARAVMRVAGRELRRREMEDERRSKIGDMVCRWVAEGVGLGDAELGRGIGECVFYAGVGTEASVLRGMVVSHGRGEQGAGGLAAGVDAAVGWAAGPSKLDGLAALQTVQAIADAVSG